MGRGGGAPHGVGGPAPVQSGDSLGMVCGDGLRIVYDRCWSVCVGSFIL